MSIGLPSLCLEFRHPVEQLGSAHELLTIVIQISKTKFEFLDEKKEGKAITYTLTPSGKKALTVAKRKFCKIFLGVFP